MEQRGSQNSIAEDGAPITGTSSPPVATPFRQEELRFPPLPTHEISVPKAPSEQLHPLIGLPISITYSAEKLRKFAERCGGSIVHTFTDAAFVHGANECGLRDKVDQIFSEAATLLAPAYEGVESCADAPGFDEFIIRCDNAQGDAITRYQDFERAWNTRRNELFPLTDERVQRAETLALLREEANALQREYLQEHGEDFTLPKYYEWLKEKAKQEQVSVPTDASHSQDFISCGVLALRIARQKHAEKIKQIAAGNLPDEERKVLSLVAGHVKVTGDLSPLADRMACDLAEKRSSERKKGSLSGAEADTAQDLNTWKDPRTATVPEVEAMVQLEKDMAALHEEALQGGKDLEELQQIAWEMEQKVSSDRELGSGVIRAEKVAGQLLGALLPDSIQVGDPFSVVTLELTGGGPFNKAVGFAAFGRVLKEFVDLLQKELDIKALFRQGGGKLHLVVPEAFSARQVVELTEKLDNLREKILDPSQYNEQDVASGLPSRIERAKLDYGTRAALYASDDKNLIGVPDFFSTAVGVRHLRYQEGMKTDNIFAA
ncbi:hypothetical protein MRY87_11650 [bacterium]|nr:hypothetical protein [bacterium]